MSKQDLKLDIEEHLKEKRTIRGFTRERLQELIAGDFEGIQGYEIRFLLVWSELYLYQFEKAYEILIDDL